MSYKILYYRMLALAKPHIFLEVFLSFAHFFLNKIKYGKNNRTTKELIFYEHKEHFYLEFYNHIINKLLFKKKIVSLLRIREFNLWFVPRMGFSKANPAGCKQVTFLLPLTMRNTIF